MYESTREAHFALRQVLSTMSLLFTLFKPSNTLARDCLIIFAIGVAFKLLFFVLFFARTANATLVPPAPASPTLQEEQAAAGGSGGASGMVGFQSV